MRQTSYSVGTNIILEQQKIIETQVKKDKNLKTKTVLVEPRISPGQSVPSPNN